MQHTPDEDVQAMLEVISEVLGPFFGKIVKGKIVIDIPPPKRPAGPLVGYGDQVEIGTWVRTLGHGEELARMPMQVVHYTLKQGDDSVALLNRVNNASFNYTLGNTRFIAVPLDDVPLYLREALPRNQADIDTWRMLTKAELLRQFAGKSEAVCYVILFTLPYKAQLGERPRFVHRDLMPMRFIWTQGKSRVQLANIAEVWPCNANEYGNVGERQILDNGYILSKKCYGYAIFAPEGSGMTVTRFMRHCLKQKWQLDRLAELGI